ncbi:MAG: hypothetical protein ACYCTI_01285 [Acidimicrobiales bacterium]
MTVNASPGTITWARQVFAEEMTALGVVCDERAALDGELDALAVFHGISRRYLVQTYLEESTIRAFARRAATAATGLDPGLLVARAGLDEDYPEAAGWPEEIRNYLIDHRAAHQGAVEYAQATTGGRLGIEETGLLRFRYTDPSGLASALDPGGGSVAVLTIQHPDVLVPGRALRADPAWGRPIFEWAYRLMEDSYRNSTGIDAARLIWAWADLATVAAAQRPELAVAGAIDSFGAANGNPEAVAVLARVPVERCLFTSHLLFDGFVLRGRYAASDIEDALGVHRRFGRTHLDPSDPADPIRDTVIASWVERLLGGADRADVRLQVCLDRIEPDEILSVVPLKLGPRPATSGGQSTAPERLVNADPR